ncbi:MAG: FAD-dependent oxidoreductase [Bilophila wadsworthia]
MDAGRAADLYDAVVVGGGPAGGRRPLPARARYRVLVVEKDTFGGQITITAEVVNYPGVEKTEGHSLTETMRRQALHFGAEFLLAEAQGIDVDGDFRIVRTSRGAFRCFAVLLATGAHPRKVGFEGEETFRGRGVAYCATCDGGFFTDRDVFVVGGGFAAAEEAMFLTRYARSVTMLVRRSTLSCAESIAEQVLAHESVRVRFNTVLEAVEGDTALRRAVFRDTVTGRLETYAPPEGETFGVFVFAGYEPASRLAEGLAELTGQGNIVTDREQRTRTEGVYAAGDVCDKRLRQVVTAVSDGAVAATSIERYAADMRARGLRPQRPATPGVSGAESLSPFRKCPRQKAGSHGGAAGTVRWSLRPHGTPAHPKAEPTAARFRKICAGCSWSLRL